MTRFVMQPRSRTPAPRTASRARCVTAIAGCTLTAALALLAALPTAAHAQQSDSTNTYYVVMGTDTIASELATRTPTQIAGTFVDRLQGNRVAYTSALAPDASVTSLAIQVSHLGDTAGTQKITVDFHGDSATAHFANGRSVTVASAAGAVPYVSPSPSLLDQIVRRARAIGGATPSVPLFQLTDGSTVQVPVTFPSSDSAVVDIGGAAIHVALASDGSLRGYDYPTRNVRAIVVPGTHALADTPPHYTVPGGATPASADPRVGLRAGWENAQQAASNLQLVAHVSRPAGFVDTTNPGSFGFANSDLAFDGHYVIQGNFNGFQIWDVSKRSHPTLTTGFVCPGGQGDVSVYKNLLFMSVEEERARVDCGSQGIKDSVSAERFRGVRIFDISDIHHPKQVAAVQTCRGSHTHTLVTDPKDPADVYVYVSGIGPVRPAAELAGCSGAQPAKDSSTSLFRIDVIRVPVAAPQNARIIGHPRIFANTATGAVSGLWKGGDHGPGSQNTAQTNSCHDITAYTAIGLAAGACAGNGILLDISDPAHPKRVAQVSDPNFAYWHSATFDNAGTTVVYSDEWGGGVAPRCRVSDPPLWGSDAIFTRHGDSLHRAGHYKLPAPQTDKENCVAHNGSLIPIPGRDIMAQAWYQGGVSVFDFTDPAHPKEIAFFDRGPMDSTKLVLGGFWSAYWYNGRIYGSEIGRGLDEFRLTPSKFLSKNEIDAAKLVRFAQLNVQDQPRFVWPARFVVARAYVDQLRRDRGISSGRASSIARELSNARKMTGAKRHAALMRLTAELARDESGAADASRVQELQSVVRRLANTSR